MKRLWNLPCRMGLASEAKRTPTSSRLKKLENVLPLHVFVHQQQILGLFRQFHRALRDVEDVSLRADIRKQVNLEFQKNKSLGDKATIRTLLKEGKRQLTMLQSLSTKRSGSSNKASNEGGNGHTSKDVDPNSWIAMSEEGDQRGRVGQGWPWSK